MMACERPKEPAGTSSPTEASTAASRSGPTLRAADRESPTLDLITLRDCIRIASLIANGPTWNVDGDLDDADAQWLVDLAHSLQQLDPTDVERVLTVYSARLPDERALPDARGRIDGVDMPDPWTNPVLLIRVMIDVSEESLSLDRRRYLQVQRIALGGGFGAMRPSGTRSEFEQSAAFPVMWRHDRPHLAAGRAVGMGGTGMPLHDAYDPAREFRALHQ